MIIEDRELQNLLRVIEELNYSVLSINDAYTYYDEIATTDLITTDFFYEYPHLIMQLGFDDYKTYLNMKDNSFESIFRLRKSGAYKKFVGLTLKNNLTCLFFSDMFNTFDQKHQLFIPINKMIDNINKAIKNPPTNPFSLLLPAKLTYSNQTVYKNDFAKNVRSLIYEISKNEKSLDEIHPRQFEELIAVLLQNLGMDVELTPYTHDGGRDIIARSKLETGDTIIMAVEAKRKKITELDDVQKALYANKNFPYLLLATSGRFSAGVIKEKNKPENEYRLILKDGVSIYQWIHTYNEKCKK
jgi:HJR/Mrr/RecB family endonuclease